MRSPSFRPLPAGDTSTEAARPDAAADGRLVTERPRRAWTVVDLVGRTPLIEINRLTGGVSRRVRVLAKLEGFNPGGSVKDRPAREALRSGALHHEEQLDRKINVSTDTAYEMVHRLGSEEGLLVGQSSGAAMVAALQVAQEIDDGVIVVIFPDCGDRYLSPPLWRGRRDWKERVAAPTGRPCKP